MLTIRNLIIKLQYCIEDFPGGPVVKNPPSNAGDVGSISGRGTKIPHAAGQLSPRGATTEPTRHNEHPTQPKKKKENKKTNTV